MFDKIKNRMLKRASEKSMSEKTDSPSVDHMPAESDADTYNKEYLLTYLKHKEPDFQNELEALEPYLDDIQIKVNDRVLLIQEMSSAQSEDAEEAIPPLDAEEGAVPPLDAEEGAVPPLDAEEEAIPPLNADVELLVSQDRMTAFLYILSPSQGGAEVEESMVLTALTEHEIIYGINTELIAEMVSTKSYNKIGVVARGKHPVFGTDGYITDYFKRQQSVSLDEDEFGNVDYKSLNIFQNIKAGEVICDIVNPTSGTDGCDVKGTVLTAKGGKMPVVPKGKNTSVNAEGSALVADIDGDITFTNGLFRVERQLVIPGNVDGSTGNLDFNGDLRVNGDVINGFSVKANGNVIVCGMVEGAYIEAANDIELKKGMNGSGEGKLKAGGDVRSRFLEQTQVDAKGDVIAEAIVNCEVVCGGSIRATNGMGSIISGSLSAGKTIQAKRIGNLSNIKTNINIGYTASEEKSADILNGELKKTRDTLERLCKNISYLESLKSMPEDKAVLYHTLCEQKGLYEAKVREISDQLIKLTDQQTDFTGCYVQGDVIYPITKVTLNHSCNVLINDTTHKCKIYYLDGSLSVGVF